MHQIFSYDGPLISALTKLGDCICLSAMWLLFSLPFLTVGASTTALYLTAYRCLRRERGALWKTFWNAFRENFARSTLLWLAVLAVLVLLTVDIFVLRRIRQTVAAAGTLYWVVLALWCAALTWAFYVAAYAARFNGSVWEVLRFSFTLLTLHPIKALGVLLPLLAGAALALLMPFMILITPAAVFWIGGLTTEKVFRLHMRPEDLEKDADGENGGEHDQ